MTLSTNLDNVGCSEKLFFYCHQLDASVKNLRDSINKYESYKETKKKSLMDSSNDRE